MLVETATPEQRTELLRHVLAGAGFASLAPVSAVRNFEAYLRSSRLTCVALQVLSGRQLVAAVVVLRLPGDVGVLMLPEPGRLHIDYTAQQAAIQAALDRPELTGTYYAQALVEPEAAGKQNLLEQFGFRRITTLLYLERPAGGPPPATAALPQLTWRSYSADTHDAFARVVAETYVDSHDCPEISGLRPVDAALQSHQAGGVFDPQRWELAWLDGAGAGCLLLAHLPHAGLLEIVYMGVCPAQRRHGLGRALLRRAWEHAQALRVRQLTLVVDQRNTAAFELYRRCGFRAYAERDAWLRPAAR